MTDKYDNVNFDAINKTFFNLDSPLYNELSKSIFDPSFNMSNIKNSFEDTGLPKGKYKVLGRNMTIVIS